MTPSGTLTITGLSWLLQDSWNYRYTVCIQFERIKMLKTEFRGRLQLFDVVMFAHIYFIVNFLCRGGPESLLHTNGAFTLHSTEIGPSSSALTVDPPAWLLTDAHRGALYKLDFQMTSERSECALLGVFCFSLYDVYFAFNAFAVNTSDLCHTELLCGVFDVTCFCLFMIVKAVRHSWSVN